jgi:hypothetical protein
MTENCSTMEQYDENYSKKTQKVQSIANFTRKSAIERNREVK